MSNFNEADHPRDDIGRFTYKNGGAGSSSTGGILKGKVEYPDNRGGDSSEGGKIGDKIGDILTGVLGVVLNPQTISTILSILATKYTVSEMIKIKEELYDYMEKHSNSSNVNGTNPNNKETQNIYENIGLGMDNSLLKGNVEKQYNLNNIRGFENQRENDNLRKRLEYERKMEERANILFSSMSDNNKTKNNYPNTYNKDDYIQNVLNTNTVMKSVMYEPIIEHYGYNEDYKPIHDTYRKILIDANTYAGKANIDGFSPYFSDANHKTGFYGRAYINNKDKTVVIAYKGTDEKSAIDWVGNNFLMKLTNTMPMQFKDAEQFYFDVREKLISEGKNYKFDFAGYSLGGTLAQLMGAKYGNETVTFNAFGIGQMKNAEINYKSNIINYGHKYDAVYNMGNTMQIGKNVYTKNEHDKDFVKNIKKYHEMQNIGDLRKRY